MGKFVAPLVALTLVTACSNAPEATVPTSTIAPPTTATAPPTTTGTVTTTAASVTTTLPTTTTFTGTPSSSTAPKAPENTELDQAFGVAVEEYIATNWAGWSEGQSLGDCLVENASAIDTPAKQGVIDYGLEEVYSHISRTDSYTLGVVWDDCETAPTSTSAKSPVSTTSTTTAPKAPENTELDQAFGVAVEEYIATNWAGWSEGQSLGDCLVENASAIDTPAKQGVIDYGLEEVYSHISRTDSYTLGVVWDDCEQRDVASTITSTSTAAPTTVVADSPDPELDQNFSIAISAGISAGWSEGERIGDCLVDNASQITSAAKRGVIDHGLGEVFEHISMTDQSSLGAILEFCGVQKDRAAESGGVLAAACTLDAEVAEISCQASGYNPVSTLKWTSTGDYSGKTGGTRSGGASWDFTVPDELIELEAKVFLEECEGSSCRTVETSVDTSVFYSEDLTVECELDVELEEISCQAIGRQIWPQLTWTSTAIWDQREDTPSWLFTVERLWDSVIRADPGNDPPGVTPGAAKAGGHQEGEIDLPVSPEIQVSLEYCKNSFCKNAETSLDGAALLYEDTAGLDRIMLSVPFDLNDPISGIIPMGETIAHAIPAGHPGMDLQWKDHPEGRPEIFASATGTIDWIDTQAFHTGAVVTDHITLGARLRHEGFDKTYFTTYGGLALDFAYELGDTIQKGELMGHIDVNPHEAGFMIHWEFGVLNRFSAESDARDIRWCPMTFFDETSRVVMEEIWEGTTNSFKDAFPYICSNVYFGRNG